MNASNRLMVVEDDSAIREALIELLAEFGYDAVGAVNGRDALEELDRSVARPSLILLDLMMPVMDGREFCEELLKRPGLAEVPVILLSAYRDVAETANGLGVDGFLTKPIHLDELLRIARRYCASDATATGS